MKYTDDALEAPARLFARQCSFDRPHVLVRTDRMGLGIGDRLGVGYGITRPQHVHTPQMTKTIETAYPVVF